MAAGFRSPLLPLGIAATSSTPAPPAGGHAGLLAFWIGGAGAVPTAPPPAAMVGFHSLFAWWMRGGGLPTPGNFEAALSAHLLTGEDLVAAVATWYGLACIWPNQRPEGSDVPAVVTNVIYTEPATVLDGSDGDLLNKRVQIDCWADSYDEARDLAELVRARMQTEGISFGSSMLSDQDFDEPDTKLYRVSMDFSCWYDVP